MPSNKVKNDKNWFPECIEVTLKFEGGYVNHPNDPGGETKYGISKRSYPWLDIKSISKDTAKELYYRDYWLDVGCDLLDFPLCLLVFDTAVIMGKTRALDFLEQSGWDGRQYLELRRNFHRNRVKAKPSQEVFLKGWLNRCNALEECINANVGST